MAHAVKVHSSPIPNFGILFMERHKNKSTNDSMLRVCLCSDILRQQEISPNSHACQNYSWKPVFALLKDFGRRQL